MPNIPLLEIPPQEQAHMLAALRRARYGDLLALQVFLLGAAKRTPSAMAACLCCSRSSVSRIVTASRTGTPGFERAADGPRGPPGRPTVLTQALKRALVALLQAAPHPFGGCRTRWSGAPLAVP
jgi:hypothetical protein